MISPFSTRVTHTNIQLQGFEHSLSVCSHEKGRDYTVFRPVWPIDGSDDNFD